MMIKSKDIALLERDWDLLNLLLSLCRLSRKTSPCSKGIETFVAVRKIYTSCRRKTSPCSKGIETPFYRTEYEDNKSKDIALLERDWDNCRSSRISLNALSKDIALLERDWDHHNRGYIHNRQTVERHRPARKGLRQLFLFWSLIWITSKDIALLERDWDTHPYPMHQITLVRRKTSPCSKGIETNSLF